MISFVRIALFWVMGSVEKSLVISFSAMLGILSVGFTFGGDIMKLYIKVEGDIIVDAKFKTLGCGAAIASSSILTDMIKGKNLEEVKKVSNKAVAEALGGLPARKRHCSVLAEEALESALEDYYKRQQHPEVAGTSSHTRECCLTDEDESETKDKTEAAS